MAAGASVTLAEGAAAQSLLDRPANLSGDWVGTVGTLYFHFLHRFTASDEPERKVSNAPTFLLAAGLPGRTLLGLHYATNSQLAPRYPNEWEFFARFAPFAQENGSPLDVAGQVGYNLAAEGVDGEVSLSRQQGRVRLVTAGRVLSDPFEAGGTRFALAGGGTVRLGRYLALAGDLATLLNREEGEEIAWSAGIQLAIPNTPHTFSLQAANTNNATLQGASRGSDDVRYGFEFTIPITLRRYFGGGAKPTAPAGRPAPPVTPTPAADTAKPAPAAPGAGKIADAGMRNFAFTPARIEIAAGTTVRWKNNDPVAHTVTADDGSLDSGLIDGGATWSRTFDRPGEYPFHCTPHPFMKGVVVVR